jgi:hypothetical protein
MANLLTRNSVYAYVNETGKTPGSSPQLLEIAPRQQIARTAQMGRADQEESKLEIRAIAGEPSKKVQTSE